MLYHRLCSSVVVCKVVVVTQSSLARWVTCWPICRRLDQLLKRYERGELQSVDWLDPLALKRIERVRHEVSSPGPEASFAVTHARHVPSSTSNSYLHSLGHANPCGFVT